MKFSTVLLLVASVSAIKLSGPGGEANKSFVPHKAIATGVTDQQAADEAANTGAHAAAMDQAASDCRSHRDHVVSNRDHLRNQFV